MSKLKKTLIKRFWESKKDSPSVIISSCRASCIHTPNNNKRLLSISPYIYESFENKVVCFSSLLFLFFVDVDFLLYEGIPKRGREQVKCQKKKKKIGKINRESIVFFLAGNDGKRGMPGFNVKRVMLTNDSPFCGISPFS